jgi:O-acetyl-ADP-ribose deacetylase (regulator of RNase III)
MLIHKTGNIFTSEQPAIGHGVNCKGVMGSGIAVTVRKLFPEVYEVYKLHCQKIGLHGGEMLPLPTNDGRVILNLASQEKTGANARYDFLEESVLEAFAYCQRTKISAFALPQIGSGIGGLEWDKVLQILTACSEKFPNIDLEVWTYDGS